MTYLIQIVGAALLAAVLTALLRPVSPAMTIVFTAACSILLLLAILEPLGNTLNAISQMLATAGIDGSLYLPVIKAVGISVLVRITAELCRDSGQGALAAKLELAGAVTSIAVCVPLIQQVFQLLGMMME
ncbi:MAG: SpoIIIAC/SpoIIIAD family protein [Butyricicoccus sp.]